MNDEVKRKNLLDLGGPVWKNFLHSPLCGGLWKRQPFFRLAGIAFNTGL